MQVRPVMAHTPGIVGGGLRFVAGSSQIKQVCEWQEKEILLDDSGNLPCKICERNLG